MKIKKKYEKPSTKVFELKQRPVLLVGSNGEAGVNDYNWNTPDEE